MKNMFRWKGLIAFVVIAGGLAAVLVLFADNLVKKGIEVTGTRLVGAKVELADLDLSLFPVGLDIDTMRITNPQKPMTNAAEISRLAFSLEPLPLLRKKVHINEMAVTGLRFNTERKRSGAVKKSDRPQKKESTEAADRPSRFRLPDFDNLDVRDILAKESLQSTEEIKRLQATVAEKKESFQARLKELPDRETFREYESRIKALQDKSGLAGIAGGVKEAAEIKDEIQADLDRVKEARRQVERATAGFQEQLAAVSRAPGQDVKRLTNKYSLTPAGLGNMTGLLFGPKYQRWVETGLTWYRKLQPVLAAAADREAGEPEVKPARGKGVKVLFQDRTATPNFLIRLADVSAETRAGNISGTIRDITTQQQLLGRPLTYRFESEKMERLEEVAIDGQLNHVDPDHPRDTLNVQARGFQINDLTISGSEDFPVTLEQGRADCRLEAVIENQVIDSRGDVTVDRTRFSLAAKKEANQLEKAVAGALADVSRVSLKARLEGPLDDYRVSVSSNLDDVMKKAVSTVVAEQARVFERRLKKAVAEKTSGPLKDLRGDINGLDAIKKELTGRLQVGQEALSFKSSSTPSFNLGR